MTMANIPLAFLAAVVVISGVYAFVGGGTLLFGRSRSRPGAERFGYALLLASGYTVISYSVTILLWMGLYAGAGSFGLMIGTGVVLTGPFVVVLPLLVALILHKHDSVRKSKFKGVTLTFALQAFLLVAGQISTFAIRL